MKLLVPGCLAVSIFDRRWFAVRVKTSYDLRQRCGATDVAFASLREMGYDVYLPRRRLDRFNRRQRVMAEWSEPLMPGYLFLVHPRPGQPVDDWREVKSLDEVIGPLGDGNRHVRIPPAVIEMLMTNEFGSVYDETAAAKRMRGGTERQRLEARFQPGTTFIVNDGPFASFLATVDSLTHDDRVRVLVDILGRMAPVKLKPSQLDEAPVRKVGAA